MGLLQLIFGDKQKERMHYRELFVKQGICLTCEGDGIVRYGSIESRTCPACGGTGKTKKVLNKSKMRHARDLGISFSAYKIAYDRGYTEGSEDCQDLTLI